MIEIPLLLIFDFDGVVADSESLACAVAAAYATELGAEMSAVEGLEAFVGKQVADVAEIICRRGGVTPADFADKLLARTLAAFATRLEPVPGVEAFLKRHRNLRRCIASSSSLARLAASLEALKLSCWFENAVFSVEAVARGKPFPDVFLYAAEMMGELPAKSLVIEDSISGVRAGVAAGIPVVGLIAGSHLQDGHGELLLQAGAAAVAASYDELSHWLESAA